MTSRQLSHFLQVSAVAILVSILLCGSSFAQGLLADAKIPDAPSTAAAGAISPVPVVIVQSPRVEVRHGFWDKQNTVLFAAVAGLNATDFALTRANLQSGGRELNPLVRVVGRSTAGLAVNFIGDTAGVMGVSFLFHKTGHHKLERAVSYFNIGASASAVTYGLSHR
jgi:hypothetical protein